MFISKQHGGYYRGTEQHSGRGQYLALFSWNRYKAMDEARANCNDCKAKQLATHPDGWDQHVYHCQAHDGIGADGPRYENGKDKLWAAVRSTALSQLGHFMMGTIRIGGKSLTVSGPIGHDGLPMDLQDVPLDWRDKLVEVPEDIAAAYWGDKGHNDIDGTTADVLRKWAKTGYFITQAAKGR